MTYGGPRARNPPGFPLVSVLTPSYGQARFIRACLQSVQAQTYQNVEHIVQDGGSGDGTLDVLAAAAGASRNLSWESAPDDGQSDAVNRAFRRSQGDIIAWLNSDDGFFGPKVLQAVVECFQRHPQVDVVYGDSAYVSERGSLLRHIRGRWEDYKYAFPYECPLNQPSVFIRRRSVSGPDLLDTSLHFALDYELWIRMAVDGRRFHRLPKLLAFDRDHPSRKVRTLLAVREREWKLLEERYGIRLNLRPSLVERHQQRVLGLPTVMLLTDRHLAEGLSVPSRGERLVRQLLRSHEGQIPAGKG